MKRRVARSFVGTRSGTKYITKGQGELITEEALDNVRHATAQAMQPLHDMTISNKSFDPLWPEDQYKCTCPGTWGCGRGTHWRDHHKEM